MIPVSTIQIGAAAEALAAEFLRARGLQVIARNLRCRGGELDLVCLDGPVLVIVEVRCRSRLDYGGAQASVTAGKQRRILRAARFFWQRERAWRTHPLRFDVVAIDGGNLTWLRDAFRTR